MIRELKEEIERLRAGGASVGGRGNVVDNSELEAKMKQQEEMMRQIEQERKDFER